MNRLNKELLSKMDRVLFDEMKNSPISVLQVGEGNFLRGFVDWMLHKSREKGLFQGTVAVTQPRASGKAKIKALSAQDGLYTMLTRGIENRKVIQRSEHIMAISEAFDPYESWKRFEALASLPSLRFVFSNTTESGLVYKPESLNVGEPIQSFPGKITWLLYKRYEKFGELAKGLIFLPCELVEKNGDTLRNYVLQFAKDWGLPESFLKWIEAKNRFLNSLVDRIVTGYPNEAIANNLFNECGYTDTMLNTAEPYYLWAIEAEKELDNELPLRLKCPLGE